MSYPKGVPPVLIRDINRLHPKMQTMTKLFLDKCKEKGIPIFITQTFRTVETQKEYYSWGRTKTNPFQQHKMIIVTKCDGVVNKSRHQFGLAIDIACSAPHALYDENILRQAGEVAESLGLTWGGRWKKFKDSPHIEIPPEKVNDFKIPDVNKITDKGEDDEVVVKEKIVVNGKTVEVELIKKNNQNFIKLANLRDLNLLDIKFDNLKKQIIIDDK